MNYYRINNLKIITAYFLLSFCLILSCNKLDSNQNESSSDLSNSSIVEIKNSEKTIKDSLISIIAVGDLMLGSNYPSSVSLPPDDGKYLFDSIRNIMPAAEIVFGNLEGTFLNSGGKPKQCNTPDHCVCFRMPEHYCQYLKDAGFNLVSLANNHSNDMGEEGRLSTIKTLESYDIKYAGYSDYPFTVFEKNGIIYGFSAFAPNIETQFINDIPNAEKTISELKKKCDIVIVSFHGGAEGYSAQRVTRKREIFLGEDRGNVYEFAHKMIDAGADVILGQGPHVPRALELYKNKLIAYSLGNFCTYGKFGLSGPQGIAPVLNIFVNRKGDFVKGNIISFKQIKGGIPVPDPDQNAAKLINELTRKDFPETLLMINADGVIEKAEIN